jgi:CRP-like cAMP-binding protein
MSIDALVKPLLQISIFRGLKPLQITEIARRAERIVYRPGDTIIEEDCIGDAAVLIVSGDAVRISGPEHNGSPEPVAAGSLVGEMAMLVESIHSSTVVARGNVRAMRINRSELLLQMEQDPTLADHFLERTSGRLRVLADDLRAVDRAFDECGASAHLH